MNIDIEKEIWLPIEIKNIKNIYEVSNMGRVRKVMDRNTGKILSEPKIISQHTKNIGYTSVGIRLNGKTKGFLVHRLVASAFIPKNNNNKNIVNHINHIKTDNRASNLEWVTRTQNSKHYYQNNIHPNSKALSPVYKNRSIYRIPKTESDKSSLPDIIENNILWKAVNVLYFRSYYYINENGDVRYYKKNNILMTHKLNGYRRISLYHKKNKKNYLVHRLVALTFLPNDSKDKKVVDHINGDKTNNHVSNLRWVSHSENALNTVQNGMCNFSKFSSDIKNKIINDLKNNITIKDIVHKYNVSKITIYRLKKQIKSI